jgi:hypothetical protein
MNVRIPRRLAVFGAALITVSGVLNAALGLKIDALLYDVYPGGKMGHVGIIAGLAAIAIGLVLWLGIIRLYDPARRGRLALAGLLTVVLGHVGGVVGAIYVGTLGVALCYTAGIWALVLAVRGVRAPAAD